MDQNNLPGPGIINLTINNMDASHLIYPSPAPAPEPEPEPEPSHRGWSLGAGLTTMANDILNNKEDTLNRSNLSSSMVVEAEEVPQYNNSYTCIRDNNTITITYTSERKKYFKIFRLDDNFWELNHMFFQNDFTKFYETLKLSFSEEECQVKWRINRKTEGKVTIELYNSDRIFGFTILFDLIKEDNQIDLLEKRISNLEKENEELKGKLENIQPILMVVKYLHILAKSVNVVTEEEQVHARETLENGDLLNIYN